MMCFASVSRTAFDSRSDSKVIPFARSDRQAPSNAATRMRTSSGLKTPIAYLSMALSITCPAGSCYLSSTTFVPALDWGEVQRVLSKCLGPTRGRSGRRRTTPFVRGEPDWFDLYKAFELMRDDINSKLGQNKYEQMGWPDKKTVDVFSESAQVYRHSRAKWPEGYHLITAMKSDEAREFIQSLALAWLGWRYPAKT